MGIRLALRTVEMHDADQRVLRVESEKTVVLLYRVCFYDFHILDHYLRSAAKVHFSTKVLMRESVKTYLRYLFQ